MDTPAVRLAHFSDVHVTVRPLGWALRDLRSKRVSGWFNLKALGRGHNFRHAVAVARTLVADLRARRPDHLVFSGDATALGFTRELAHAAKLLHVTGGSPPGIAVPGNHDYYTRRAAKAGEFERVFAPWQHGERLDRHTYPFAQRVGHVRLRHRMEQVHQSRRLPGEDEEQTLGERIERAAVAGGQLVAPQTGSADFLHEGLDQRETRLPGRLVDQVDAGGHPDVLPRHHLCSAASTR